MECKAMFKLIYAAIEGLPAAAHQLAGTPSNQNIQILVAVYPDLFGFFEKLQSMAEPQATVPWEWKPEYVLGMMMFMCWSCY